MVESLLDALCPSDKNASNADDKYVWVPLVCAPMPPLKTMEPETVGVIDGGLQRTLLMPLAVVNTGADADAPA